MIVKKLPSLKKTGLIIYPDLRYNQPRHASIRRDSALHSAMRGKILESPDPIGRVVNLYPVEYGATINYLKEIYSETIL